MPPPKTSHVSTRVGLVAALAPHVGLLIEAAVRGSRRWPGAGQTETTASGEHEGKKERHIFANQICTTFSFVGPTGKII